MNTALSRDIVTTRFVYNLIQRNTFRDTLKDAVVGDYKFSAMTVDDNLGWLKCDGRSISRTTYSALFALIGTAFGSDDANTFKLPDCNGRVPGAIGSGAGLTTRAMGAKLGTETHTLTIAEMPSHDHAITDPGHAHGSVPDGTQNIFASSGAGINAADEPRTAYTASASTGIDVLNAGGGQAHNNMQPTIFLGNVYIYSGVRDPQEPQVDITGPNDTEYPPA